VAGAVFGSSGGGILTGNGNNELRFFFFRGRLKRVLLCDGCVAGVANVTWSVDVLELASDRDESEYLAAGGTSGEFASVPGSEGALRAWLTDSRPGSPEAPTASLRDPAPLSIPFSTSSLLLSVDFRPKESLPALGSSEFRLLEDSKNLDFFL